MRELLLLVRLYITRLLACMAIAWIIYNPWYSAAGWLMPQFHDLSTLRENWYYAALVIAFLGAIVLGLVLTVRSALGKLWTLITIILAGLLAYAPFLPAWGSWGLSLTWRSAGYALYFFVLPALFAAGLWASFAVRYWRGIPMMQPIGPGIHHHEVTVQTHDVPDAPHHT